MTSVTINLPDQDAALLKARAAEQGLPLEDWLQETITQVIVNPNTQRDNLPEENRAEATLSPVKHSSLVEEFRQLRATVKPDPEGWTIRDYVNYGRR